LPAGISVGTLSSWDEDVRRDIAEIRDNTRRLVELMEQVVARQRRKPEAEPEPFTTEADLVYLREWIAASRASRKS